jgi:hypothetical protein
MRPYLESFAAQDNPQLSDEEIKEKVSAHILTFIEGKKDDGFSEMLKNMGALMQGADESIEPTVAKIQFLLASCAQSGNCED